MEDSPQKIRHKEDSPHNKCDQEFECKRRKNACNSADVEDSPLNNDRLGSGGCGRECWVEGLGLAVPNSPQPPLPNHLAQTPDLNPPNPTPNYHCCGANFAHRHCCKCLSGHIRMSHPLCGESSEANFLATLKF